MKRKKSVEIKPARDEEYEQLLQQHEQLLGKYSEIVQVSTFSSIFQLNRAISHKKRK